MIGYIYSTNIGCVLADWVHQSIIALQFITLPHCSHSRTIPNLFLSCRMEFAEKDEQTREDIKKEVKRWAKKLILPLIDHFKQPARLFQVAACHQAVGQAGREGQKQTPQAKEGEVHCNACE